MSSVENNPPLLVFFRLMILSEKRRSYCKEENTFATLTSPTLGVDPSAETSIHPDQYPYFSDIIDARPHSVKMHV